MNAYDKRPMQSATPFLLYLKSILIFAALYYVTGRLALLLAIPPGYAAAVWPASGIALAGILMSGYRLWPGIFLGSFFVNIGTSLDATSAFSIAKSLALTSSIGMGAAVQAMTGAFLVRRFVGFPNPLDQEQDVLKFMALAGPLSCLVSATVGVTSLFLAGAISPAENLFTWCTWWVGDTLGVLIAAPLALIWAGEPREVWRQRRISVAVPLCLMLSAAIVGFVYASAWEQDRVKGDLERRAGELADAIKEKLDDHLDVLHAVEAFYASSSGVNRRDFRSFVQHAFLRYPGLQALSWDLRIAGAKRVEYEEAARREGYPEFQITEQNTQGQLIPAGERREYVAVYYIEPYKGNESALGFDIASDPIRLEALTRARDTGQPTATARIRLVQETGQEFGFRVFVPIYSRELPHDTVEQRRKNLQGFATAVFRAADIVETSVKDLHTEGIDLRFSDETAPVGKRLLYRRPTPEDSQQLKGDEKEKISVGLHWVTSFENAGRKWAMTFSPTPAYLLAQRSWQPWGVLAGALLSALLGAFLLVVTGRTAKIEVQVAQRTAELSQSNANLEREIIIRRQTEEKFRGLLESAQESEERFRIVARATNDVVWDWDLLTNKVWVSDGVRTLFGYGAEEIQDVTWWYENIHPDERERIVDGIHALIDSGKQFWSDEYRFKRADGSLAHVLDRGYMIRDSDRKAVRMIGAMMDMTERKRAEEQLAESEARLRTIVASEPECVKLLDRDGRVIEMNPAGLAMLEADSAAQVIGQSVYPVIIEEYRQQFKELNESVFQGKSGVLEVEIAGLKGTRRWLETHAAPVRDNKGKITGALSVTRDISERKRLEREISQIREEERRRLGQDLHDDLGQSLAGIALLTKGLEQRLSVKSLPEAADAIQITELVNQAVARTRSFVRGLLPVDPIAHGLTSALEELASRTEAMFSVSCKLECLHPVEVHDNSVATHLFRIAQEAVANAVKHGEARQVLISLSELDGRTVLMVSDDGVGFPEVMQEHKGMGLHIMKHRAEMIGGFFSIRCGEAGGTVLTCSFQNQQTRSDL